MRRLVAVVVSIAVVAGIGGATLSAASGPASSSSTLAVQLALARLSTAKYVTDLGQAQADGYGIITQMIPDMGWHYMNPTVTGFDVRRPQILVYERSGGHWQLGALEWVFAKRPARPPLPGARYGSFPAACHYVDGTFVAAASKDRCASTSPQSGAKFNFWHGPLVTMHVWLWYPNPSGLFAGMNPLVSVYNKS
jgi:hypothetical protein